MSTVWRPLRVLVVDDSAMVRKLTRQRLQETGRLQVVGVASSGEAAIREMIVTAPEVMLLDENLPGMQGSDFLRKLMSRCPIPAVIFTGAYSEELKRRALKDGAVAVVSKPSAMSSAGDFWEELRQTLLRASKAQIRAMPPSQAPPLVIGLAISTGGPPVVRRVLSELPPTLPPIVLVPHMRDAYVPAFAAQLDADSDLAVRLAREGEPLLRGHCYVAPPGHQCLVVGNQGRLEIMLGPGNQVSGHTPSGDALLSSIACTAGARSVGGVLTGMGADGAAGLLTMRRAGAATFAQDRDTSTVYGMPKAAAENGAARQVVPLDGIARTIVRCSRLS